MERIFELLFAIMYSEWIYERLNCYFLCNSTICYHTLLKTEGEKKPM